MLMVNDVKPVKNDCRVEQFFVHKKLDFFSSLRSSLPFIGIIPNPPNLDVNHTTQVSCHQSSTRRCSNIKTQHMI